MKYIQGTDRNQLSILPECIEDYIDEDNQVRVIDAFVNSLDMEKLGFERAVPNLMGRPSYDPRDLLKLYIYGYLNKIRSSRKLEKECTRNIELFYLLKKLTPDFRTISDFRKDNPKAIKNTFKEFGKLCLKLNLFNKELLAVDGTKIRAVNSKENCYNMEVLEKKLANIEEKLNAYLNRLDEADETENENTETEKESIKKAIKELTERKIKYEELSTELELSGETQILTTDPEARRMYSKDGFHCCYNVQTAVDSGSHLIAEFEVTNKNTDSGLLNETTEKAKELLEVKTIEVVADKGYESKSDILNCVLNGTAPTVALKLDKTHRTFEFPYEEKEITEEERKDIENIEKCIKAGVLPECYEKTGISVEIQKKNCESCFVRNERGEVTCPMGNKLEYSKKKGVNTVYYDRLKCRNCKNKCTASAFKEVSFGPETNCVPVKIFGNVKTNLQKIPDDAKISSFNHTLDTKKVPDAKVVLRIKDDKEKIGKRMCLSEHPFGTIKWYHGAHYLLCKGKLKATAEMGLSFLAYNMIRAINMIGVKKIIEAI